MEKKENKVSKKNKSSKLVQTKENIKMIFKEKKN